MTGGRGPLGGGGWPTREDLQALAQSLLQDVFPIAFLVMLILVEIVTMAEAWGHGDAAWIQANPAYIGRDNLHCCGPVDCAVAQPGEVVRVPAGWLHVPTGSMLPDDTRGIYPSIDVQVWRCVRGGELKCVFVAGGM